MRVNDVQKHHYRRYGPLVMPKSIMSFSSGIQKDKAANLVRAFQNSPMTSLSKRGIRFLISEL